MARALEDIVKQQLGAICFQNSQLVVENESLRERIEQLELALAQKGESDGKQDSRKPAKPE